MSGEELDTTPQILTGEVSWARVCLYGPEKIGKTTTLAKFLKPEERAILLSADANFTVLFGTPQVSRIQRIPWTKMGQIPLIANKLISGELKTDWLWLDPTSIAFWDWLKRLVGQKKIGAQMDEDVPSQPHYMLMKWEMREMLSNLREVPCNIAYVCHTYDGRFPIRPNLPDGTNSELFRECNLIAFMEREQGGERTITTSPSNKYKVGTQLPGVPEGTFKVDEFVRLIQNWKVQT